MGHHIPGDARAKRADQTVKDRAMSEVRSVMAMRKRNLACAEEVRMEHLPGSDPLSLMVSKVRHEAVEPAGAVHCIQTALTPTVRGQL